MNHDSANCPVCESPINPTLFLVCSVQPDGRELGRLSFELNRVVQQKQEPEVISEGIRTHSEPTPAASPQQPEPEVNTEGI